MTERKVVPVAWMEMDGDEILCVSLTRDPTSQFLWVPLYTAAPTETSAAPDSPRVPTPKPDSEYVMRLERMVEQLREMLTFSETRIDTHYKARFESAERELSAYKNAEKEIIGAECKCPLGPHLKTCERSVEPRSWQESNHPENAVAIESWIKLRAYAAAQRVRADQIAAETIERLRPYLKHKGYVECFTQNCHCGLDDAIRTLSAAEITASADKKEQP